MPDRSAARPDRSPTYYGCSGVLPAPERAPNTTKAQQRNSLLGFHFVHRDDRICLAFSRNALRSFRDSQPVEPIPLNSTRIRPLWSSKRNF